MALVDPVDDNNPNGPPESDDDLTNLDMGDDGILTDEELEQKKAAELAALEEEDDDPETEGDGEANDNVDDGSSADASDDDDPADSDAGSDNTDDAGSTADPEEDTPDAAEQSEEDEPEQGVDPTGRIKGIAVPKGRFDEMSQRVKARDARIAQLEREAEEAKKREAARVADDPLANLDVGTDITKALELAQDPDTAGDAASLLTETIAKAAAAAAKSATASAPTAQDIEAATAQALEKREYDQTLDTMVANFPFLENPEHEKYNKDFVDELITVQEGYMRRGYSRSDALNQAVDRLVLAEYPDEYNAVYGETETQAPKKASDKTPATRRAAAQRAKNAAAQKATPPKLETTDTNKAGAEDARTLDISAMTDDELAALPQSTLDELLGNTGA